MAYPVSSHYTTLRIISELLLWLGNVNNVALLVGVVIHQFTDNTVIWIIPSTIRNMLHLLFYTIPSYSEIILKLFGIAHWDLAHMSPKHDIRYMGKSALTLCVMRWLSIHYSAVCKLTRPPEFVKESYVFLSFEYFWQISAKLGHFSETIWEMVWQWWLLSRHGVSCDLHSSIEREAWHEHVHLAVSSVSSVSSILPLFSCWLGASCNWIWFFANELRFLGSCDWHHMPAESGSMVSRTFFNQTFVVWNNHFENNF